MKSASDPAVLASYSDFLGQTDPEMVASCIAQFCNNLSQNLSKTRNDDNVSPQWIGVAAYHLQSKLPPALKGKLPTAKQLSDVVRALLPEKTGVASK